MTSLRLKRRSWDLRTMLLSRFGLITRLLLSTGHRRKSYLRDSRLTTRYMGQFQEQDFGQSTIVMIRAKTALLVKVVGPIYLAQQRDAPHLSIPNLKLLLAPETAMTGTIRPKWMAGPSHILWISHAKARWPRLIVRNLKRTSVQVNRSTLWGMYPF